MRYGSICSGIEAASVAWAGLGWHAQFFAEIDPLPSAVLAARWPGVPNLGDFTRVQLGRGAVDLLVGGTPCQSFSLKGWRLGLADERGNLALEFARLTERLQPQWIVWENVPGVLSANGGRDFGSILGALADLGYGIAYRVLDARFFGVPQRRERVFVVGCLGDVRAACAVLFEPEGMPGNSATGRASPQTPASRVPDSAVQDRFAVFGRNNSSGPVDSSHALRAKGGSGNIDFETETFVLDRWRSRAPIRRFTPREFERLQGFPDDYTLIPYPCRWKRKDAADTASYLGLPVADVLTLANDSLRYRAVGNSMAVPVMRWLGQRIATVSAAGATT